jgi:hypothetical protein
LNTVNKRFCEKSIGLILMVLTMIHH